MVVDLPIFATFDFQNAFFNHLKLINATLNLSGGGYFDSEFK